MTTRRGAIIGSVRTAATIERDAVGQPIAGGEVAGVNALDVEGAQPLFDQLGELRGERRLLDLVLALQQVERDRACRRRSACERRRE